MMNESLTKAMHDAQFLTADLRAALHHAHAAEALVVMRLISKSAKLEDAIRELREAVNEDAEGRAQIPETGGGPHGT